MHFALASMPRNSTSTTWFEWSHICPRFGLPDRNPAHRFCHCHLELVAQSEVSQHNIFLLPCILHVPNTIEICMDSITQKLAKVCLSWILYKAHISRWTCYSDNGNKSPNWLMNLHATLWPILDHGSDFYNNFFWNNLTWNRLEDSHMGRWHLQQVHACPQLHLQTLVFPRQL